MSDLISQITSTEKPQETKTPDSAEIPKVKIVTEADLLSGPAADQTPATATEAAPEQTPAIEAAPEQQPAPEAAPAEPIKRGRGRPKGSTNKPRADFSDVATVAAKVDYNAMSGALFDMSTGMLTTTFGPEWQPRSADERAMVVGPLAQYLQSKQVQDIPPGVMVCVVIAAYAGPRLAVPTTANKVKPAVAWCWAKIKGFFKRKPVVLSVIPGQQNNQ